MLVKKNYPRQLLDELKLKMKPFFILLLLNIYAILFLTSSAK